MKRLQAFHAELAPLKWSSPLELSEHRREIARRLKDEDDSPYLKTFEFPAVDLASIKAEADGLLADLRHAPPEFLEHVERDIRDAVKAALVISSHRDEDFSAWSRDQHGLPAASVIAHAQDVLARAPSTDPEPDGRPRSEATRLLRKALDNYGLKEWQVTLVDNMAAEAAVNGPRKEIKLREGAMLNIAELRRLIVHEVGGHVLRWENAWRQVTPWAAFAFGNPTATEEGLAALAEEQLGVATGEVERKYAQRVLAVVAAQEMDMMELARFLSRTLDPMSAASLTLRVRRGLVHPTSTGGMTKDHAYLTGLTAVRRLLLDDPQSIKLMRSTKWPLDLLPTALLLAEVGELREPGLVATPDLLVLG